MITAEEARKVSLEAQEAKKHKQSLEQARKLKKTFENCMKHADFCVKSGMKVGSTETGWRWEGDEFPYEIHEQFEKALKDAGYALTINRGDEGEGWELKVSWSK